MRTAPSVAVASLLLAVSLAACGGSDENKAAQASGDAAAASPAASTPAAPALSLQAFHDKAQAACKRLQEEGAALPKPTTPDEATTYVANILEASRRAVTTIKSLTPPAEQADEIQRDFVQPLSDQLDAAVALADPATAGDEDRQAELKKKAVEARDRVNTYAANNDLSACVQPV